MRRALTETEIWWGLIRDDIILPVKRRTDRIERIRHKKTELKQNLHPKYKNKKKELERVPCFGGAEKVLCISPRMVINWMTQWSFQCPPLFKTSTSSFASSNSIMSGNFFKALRFLVLLDGSITESCEPRFMDPAVRSIVAAGALCEGGGANPTPGTGGMKEWGNIKGICPPKVWKPWKNGRGGTPLRWTWNSPPAVGWLVVETPLALLAPTCGAAPCKSIAVFVHDDNIGLMMRSGSDACCQRGWSARWEVEGCWWRPLCRVSGRSHQRSESESQSSVGGWSRRMAEFASCVNGSRPGWARADVAAFLALPGGSPWYFSTSSWRATSSMVAGNCRMCGARPLPIANQANGFMLPVLRVPCP